MPKLSNKGFGLIPLLIVISFLSVLSFVSYYFYYQDFQDEDVLQSTSEGSVRDINGFIFRYIFNSQNLAEFNRNNTGLLITMSEELDKCVFSPRSSKPLNVRYSLNGKNSTARIHQNVSVQVIPTNMSSKKYTVVIPLANAEIKFTEEVSLIKNSCGTNTYIFEQPSTTIDNSNFSNFIVNGGGTGNTRTSNAKIKLNYETYEVSVTPSEDGTLLDPNVYKQFTQKGVRIDYTDSSTNRIKTVYLKKMSCTGNCNQGFKFKIDLDAPNKITFPAPANVRYDVERSCLGDNEHGINQIKLLLPCPIGMLNK